MVNHEAVPHLPAEKPEAGGKVIYADFEKRERIEQIPDPRERTDKQAARIEAVSKPDNSELSGWEVMQQSAGNFDKKDAVDNPDDEKSAWEVIQESAGNSAESIATPEAPENNSESTETPANTLASEEISEETKHNAEQHSPEEAKRILNRIGQTAEQVVPEDTAKNTESKKALTEAKNDETKQMGLKDLLKGFKNNAVERVKLRAADAARNLLYVEEEVSTPRDSLNIANTQEIKDMPALNKIKSNVEKAIFDHELSREERDNLSEEEQQAFLGAYEAATKRFYDRQIKKLEEEAHAINVEVDENTNYTKEYAERIHKNREEAIRLKQAALERWSQRKQIALNTLRRGGKAIGRFSLRSGKALSAGFKAMKSAWKNSKNSK